MMKKALLTAFIYMIGHFVAIAQTCGTGGIMLSSQSDVNNFSTMYPGCTEIVGNVTISGADITNLNGLSDITLVRGGVLINNNPLLSSLSGLENLTGVVANGISNPGFFALSNNPALTSVAGLASLNYVHNDFGIADCNALTSLNGLAALDSIGNQFYIYGTPLLKNLSGLSNVKRLGGVYVDGSAGLTSLDGLDAIDSLGMLVDFKGISDYSALSTLTELHGDVIIYRSLGFTGLENIETIGGHFELGDTYSLGSLASLKTVTGSLRLFNTQLANLSGLSSLESVGGLDIENNLSLSNCAIEAICAFLTNNGSPATIVANATGCGNVNEVKLSLDCQSFLGANNITSFTGAKSGSAILLQWQTEGENNVSQFEIERRTSAAGNFEKIGQVSSLGNFAGIQSYSFSDGSFSLNNFYRLKQINQDNLFSYSEIISIGGASPLCPPGSITFTSQSQVDAFAVNYPGCDVTSGGVFIRAPLGQLSSDITNLNALASITEIWGSLEISRSQLTNFSGLNNLKYIRAVPTLPGELPNHSGELYITYNAQLEDFSGLNALEEIGGEVNISNNPDLESLNGLDNLDRIGTNFSISNTKFQNLEGIPLLNSCGGLTLTENTELTSLTGFPQLASLNSLEIINNPKLTSLNNVAGAVTSMVAFRVGGNTSLPDLTGMGTIDSLTIFQVSGSLNSFQGMSALRAVRSLHISFSGSVPGFQGLETLQAADDISIAATDANPNSYRNFNGLQGVKTLNRFELVNVTLDNFTGLSSLKSVAMINFLRVKVQSLSGLEDIDATKISWLNIKDSYQLTDCSIKPICLYLQNSASVANINANGAGCQNRSQIVNSGACLIVFPVELISFDGTVNPEGNKLTWRTASEIANKGFEIERSANGRTFSRIGFVEGNGNSNQERSYSFTDSSPFPTTYYRLKQLDFDGESEYSKIIILKTGDHTAKVYPNPARGQLHIESANQNQPFSIKNIRGFSVMESSVLPNKPLDTSFLQNGLYLITVGKDVFKVSVQN